MRYSLQIKESAFKELQRVAKPDRLRIIAAIDALPDKPWAGKSLKGEMAGLRRLRVGNYRVIYEIIDQEVLILVVRVAHRRQVYR